MPPVWLPLALFLAGTVVSLAFSSDPAAGRPQIRKFFVYLFLLAVYSAFRRVEDVRRLVLSWALVGGVAAALALAQFARKMQEASQQGQRFYDYYIGDRITGFMSHWMTFGGIHMMILAMLGAWLLFGPRRQRAFWLVLAAAAVLGLSLALGFTRSIWLGAAAAAVYLVCFWKPRLLLAIPVVLALLLWLNPGSVRDRALSAFIPRQDIDSNQHRVVCWRTGWEMIKAHPWLGLGPEVVKAKFNDYVPADIPRPLPVGWYGHLHSIYIHYAAERGIPVMLLLIAALLKAAWDFIRALRRLPPGRSDERFILHGAVAVILAIMVSGVFELNLGDSEVLTLFLAVLAGGYVAHDSVTRV